MQVFMHPRRGYASAPISPCPHPCPLFKPIIKQYSLLNVILLLRALAKRGVVFGVAIVGSTRVCLADPFHSMPVWSAPGSGCGRYGLVLLKILLVRVGT